MPNETIDAWQCDCYAGHRADGDFFHLDVDVVVEIREIDVDRHGAAVCLRHTSDVVHRDAILAGFRFPVGHLDVADQVSGHPIWLRTRGAVCQRLNVVETSDVDCGNLRKIKVSKSTWMDEKTLKCINILLDWGDLFA